MVEKIKRSMSKGCAECKGKHGFVRGKFAAFRPPPAHGLSEGEGDPKGRAKPRKKRI